MMAEYKARESWMRNFPPMDYLEEGDILIIRGKRFEIKDSFKWDGRRVYATNGGYVFYADELERID